MKRDSLKGKLSTAALTFFRCGFAGGPRAVTIRNKLTGDGRIGANGWRSENAKNSRLNDSSEPGLLMPRAYGQSPDLPSEAPACNKTSQSHMSGVRNAEAGRATRRDGSVKQRDLVGAACEAGSRRESGWGGGQDDPRLFYFRALLDGGRFFGGERASAGVNRKRA